MKAITAISEINKQIKILKKREEEIVKAYNDKLTTKNEKETLISNIFNGYLDD